MRGAPLIGITAAFGIAMAIKKSGSSKHIEECAQKLLATRPTAVNLSWAINRIQSLIINSPIEARADAALAEAEAMRLEDIQDCERIGQYGLGLIKITV